MYEERDAFPKHATLANIKCANPPKFKNNNIMDMIFDKTKAKELKYSLNQCAKHCRCIYQPSENRTFVHCSNKELNNIPHIMPDFPNLEIDLSHNLFNVKMENFSFLYLTKKLNFSWNNFEFIDTVLYNSFALQIDLRNNDMYDLSSEIRSVNQM